MAESIKKHAYSLQSGPLADLVLLFADKEVASVLGVSRATVWKLAAQPGFPKPVKVGSRMARWRRADIEAWVADGCQVG